MSSSKQSFALNSCRWHRRDSRAIRRSGFSEKLPTVDESLPIKGQLLLKVSLPLIQKRSEREGVKRRWNVTKVGSFPYKTVSCLFRQRYCGIIPLAKRIIIPDET